LKEGIRRRRRSNVQTVKGDVREGGEHV